MRRSIKDIAYEVQQSYNWEYMKIIGRQELNGYFTTVNTWWHTTTDNVAKIPFFLHLKNKSSVDATGLYVDVQKAVYGRENQYAEEQSTYATKRVRIDVPYDLATGVGVYEVDLIEDKAVDWFTKLTPSDNNSVWVRGACLYLAAGTAADNHNNELLSGVTTVLQNAPVIPAGESSVVPRAELEVVKKGMPVGGVFVISAKDKGYFGYSFDQYTALKMSCEPGNVFMISAKDATLFDPLGVVDVVRLGPWTGETGIDILRGT